jgi:PAS domain S-box-containing protein
MPTLERVLPSKSNQMVPGLRYLLDSVLACAGCLLVTAVIVMFHLYPAIPNISIVYLLVVLALAITRGRYAAILSALVAFLSLSYFIVPPLHTFGIYLVEEWIALFIFLVAAVLTGHLEVALRERAEQANHRENEAYLLSEVVRATSREAQARAAELEAIFEAMVETVIVSDVRGEIRYTNPAYRSTLALEEDTDPSLLQLDTRYEWLALRDTEGRLVPKEHMPVMRVLQGERLSGTHTIDLLCRTRKGEDIIHNFSGAPIRDATGQIVGGVVVSRDVTGQYRLKQQLQYSEHKLRSLVESNIFGITVSDTAGRMYETNERLVQMLGYSKDELLAETFNWYQLIPPDLQQAEGQHIQTLLTTGTLPPWEKEYLRKDGKRVPVLVAATMIDQQKHHALRVILDMSEQKAAERRKQEFLSMVSHELRTPLTSIMGLIELSLMQIERRPGSLSPDADGLLDQIEKMLKRASGQVEIETRLVEELLEVSRLEMHKFELSLQRENLITIVEETVSNQQQAARSRQIELALPPDKVVPVLVDAGRIGQVLTNYLTNALKFAPVDQPISVCLEVEARSARVSVRDQGPGLTPDQQQRMWERFYQGAAPGYQGPDGGLGLGLAIAKVIIEQHQGQVGAESRPGQGSTFWFTVPLADGLIQA